MMRPSDPFEVGPESRPLCSGVAALVMAGAIFAGCGEGTAEEGADLGCRNTCVYASDDRCDDGGPDASFSLCPLGTDCDDCGPRADVRQDELLRTGIVSLWVSREECPAPVQQFCATIEGKMRCAYTQPQQPRCGDLVQAATFEVPAGSVVYTANAFAIVGGAAWLNRVDVDADECLLIQLLCS